MKKDYSTNYVFLFYDIREKRVQKVFKVCKKYLTHHQLSTFRGYITPSKLLSLKMDLIKVIDLKEDTISIVKLPNKDSFVEEILGQVLDDDNSLFY